MKSGARCNLAKLLLVIASQHVHQCKSSIVKKSWTVCESPVVLQHMMTAPSTAGLLDSPTSLQPEGVAEQVGTAKDRMENATVQEQQARTLNAIFPPDDGRFREPVCHRHTTADSGWISNIFSSLLGTSQKDLENKFNDTIHQKVTLLETSLHTLSLQCSAQSDFRHGW